MESVSALEAHRFLLRAGLAAVHIFAWIFIALAFIEADANVSKAFVHVAVLYAISQLITIFATPYSAKMLAYGTHRMIVCAIFSLAAAFVVLAASFSGALNAATSVGYVVFAVFLDRKSVV